jgi:3-oxoacyl-[acyl-carrier protein] reductase
MTVTYDFSGKTAIVTGAARGIGKSIAERLNSCGAKVWGWDIAAVDMRGVYAVLTDVTKPDQINGAVQKVLQQSGRIDILVNNAGYGGGSLTVEELNIDEWRRIIDTNLTSVFQVCSQVVPHMRRAGTGRIVNMASLTAKEGFATLSAYSSASAGVVAFTKALGKELATTPIRVNCIAPAAIDTELIWKMGKPLVDGMIAKSPMQRLGTVDEVAELVAWLCSEACTFNSGAVFDLSGGRATY